MLVEGETLNRKVSVLLSLAVIGVVAALITTTTTALFTDSATSTGNTFATGTLDIKLTDDSEGPLDTVSGSITYSNMAPGDTAYKPIAVSNAGTLQLRYAMGTTITDSTALAGQIAVTIAVVASAGACDASAFTGSPVLVSGPGALTAAGFGDPTPTQQSGDRQLNAGSSEVLCLRANLPIGTNDTFQGLTTTALFTFTAEQTANN